jgi:hypothetical protein
MNKKITFLALPGKCPGLAASGSRGAAEAVWESRSAAAIAPNPTPHSFKNQRRETPFGIASNLEVDLAAADGTGLFMIRIQSVLDNLTLRGSELLTVAQATRGSVG